MGTLLILCSIFTAACSRQMADEFKAWTPWMIGRLIAFAVRLLPEDRRDRYGEEWSSYAAEIPGEIGKIITVLNFSLAALRISFESRNESRKVASASVRIRHEIVLIALFLNLAQMENRKVRRFCLLLIIGAAILACRVVALLGLSTQRHATPLTLEEGILIAIVCASGFLREWSLGNKPTAMAI